jgi:hypothetical protein
MRRRDLLVALAALHRRSIELAGSSAAFYRTGTHDRGLAMKMNYWDSKWNLNEAQCPCDIHFNDWIDARRLTGKSIYHFGTGKHHIVGIRQATSRSDNVVFAITASPAEYEAYVKLVTEQPQISKSYLVYFGDIYLTNPRLFPDFDILALFHLGEFFAPNTASPEYGGLTDLSLTRTLLGKTRPGGNVLIFTGSFAHDKAEAVAMELEAEAALAFVEAFKTLLVYRKAG